ncbi:penicillin-binding protein 2 [Reyranella sp. MMS21-HV4-11]|jgi:penicillin-binding protein 2|uniref:Penicillin-binding protein 2 n=1 Tax=Reyranella humidisoli TaxID=2849149 RepID=A0ABS6IHW3_9HYPH|nr:penicillin-binding protein 2 [Reyranella sp. MMS21-HV4-11]MBU8874182.1 penicillin-binding protein 2 [Reyranella sp. MMS21-HV4-11]
MKNFRKGDGERSGLFTRRALVLGGAQAVLLTALAGRLYQLQVVETDRFATMAEENRINMRLLAPSRGQIFDRSGVPLAVNRNNFRAMATSDRGRGADLLVERLDQIFSLGEAEKVRLLRELRRSRSAQPIVVRENLGWEEVARLEFNAPDLPGVFIDLGQSRDYPEGELMSHIVGYTGRVADEDLAGRDDPVLQLATMRFGKKGVERSLEDNLRGRAGAVQVEVNAVGRVVRELDRTEGQPGANALLTIDLDIQRFAMEKMKEHKSGSVVVLDVVTGDVIAMVSTPGFDPSTFARGITQTEWRDLLDNPERPLHNKAIAGVYPPGSTYKMVTALAALEAKVIDPWTRLPCAGFLELGNIKFHCWLKGGHGSTNVSEAIAMSCDCFFYEAARRAGIDRVSDMAQRLGFGKVSELGLPGESAANQPTRAWKQEKMGKPWQHGDTFNLGIGQGYMTATPLQLAIMTARIANGGYEVQPNLLLAKATPREELVPPPPRTKPTAPSLRLNPQHLAIVRQGMSDVVNSSQGTANALRVKQPEFTYAGKTGTAQVKRITEREREMGITQASLPWHLRHHALFVCYGPVDNPRYACAVIVEHGQAGGATAGPIGRDVLVETMKRDPSRRTDRFKKMASR